MDTGYTQTLKGLWLDFCGRKESIISTCLGRECNQVSSFKLLKYLWKAPEKITQARHRQTNHPLHWEHCQTVSPGVFLVAAIQRTNWQG